jgi:glycosyltransferase involved in cell wall biosynthesis
MRVALLHHTYPPVPGGVERVVREHARLFAMAGHEVTVLTGEGAGSDPGIRVVVLPELLAQHPAAGAARDEVLRGPAGPCFAVALESITALLRLQLADQDAVFVHNVLTMPFHPALTAALADLAASEGTFRWRGRFFHWLHDAAYANPDYTLPSAERFPWGLMARPLPGVRTVAVSEHRRRQWAALAGPEARCEVVPNGVEPSAFLGLPPALADWCEQAGVFDRDLVLLHPARLVRRKNIELSLRTTRELRASGHDAFLIVTGAPDPHQAAGADYARELAAEVDPAAAVFLGERLVIGDAELAGLYRVADALLFPSRSEGFGIPPLEAALHRMPMFLSRAPALGELPFKNVTWFEPDIAPSELARRIVDRLRDDPAYADRRRMLRDYRWSGIYERQIAPLLG